MVGESHQNVFFIQIDASSFAEFEISDFEISRFYCTINTQHLSIAHHKVTVNRYFFTLHLTFRDLTIDRLQTSAYGGQEGSNQNDPLGRPGNIGYDQTSTERFANPTLKWTIKA